MTSTAFDFPDSDDEDEQPDLGQQLLTLLAETARITTQDLNQGQTIDTLIRNTAEELGEFCQAISVTHGYKQKILRESPKVEAVDLIIAALSLYFGEGGTVQLLPQIMTRKLANYAHRVDHHDKKEG